MLDCRSPSGANYIWCATNLFAGAANIQHMYRLAAIPGNNTSEALVDLVVMNSDIFCGNPLLGVSVWTDNARTIFLYNADRPDLAPTNITPQSGLHQWRNSLAAHEAYLFMSYDAGGEQPGVQRLSLYNADLRALGVPASFSQSLLPPRHARWGATTHSSRQNLRLPRSGGGLNTKS